MWDTDDDVATWSRLGRNFEINNKVMWFETNLQQVRRSALSAQQQHWQMKKKPKRHSPSNDTCQHQFPPLFISQQLSPPVAGTLFPARALTPKPNWRLLPWHPKHSNPAACACYHLRKRGTLIDEMRSLIHQYRCEAQAHNHLVASSLANMRTLLAEIEHTILSLLTQLLGPVLEHSILSTTAHTPSTNSLALTYDHPHPPLTHEIPSPLTPQSAYGPFHITGDPACRLRSASLANIDEHRSHPKAEQPDFCICEDTTQ